MERLESVSLCMIVKNEEKYLRQCLESVKNLVDEIIIVDTGSTDKTVDIAKEFDARIEYFQWNGSFSDARNYSLKFPTKKWVLLLDGDDEFDKEHYDNFINLVNTSDKDGHLFKTLSYSGNKSDNNISYNLNIRLIRNNMGYGYSGKIHEQLMKEDGEVDWSKFTIEDIQIYHYGYLQSVVNDKKKSNRNIELIEGELTEDPENRFHMYNLGVEYYSVGEVEKAYEILDKAYNGLNVNLGYGPKLVIKRVLCLMQLKRYDEGIAAIDEGLTIYPGFTDLEYVRGLIYKDMRKFTLAIDSFNKCISMGNPSVHLEVMSGCADVKSLENLGNIYSYLSDYERAIRAYEGCLKIDSNNYYYLYRICALQRKCQPDDYAIRKSMEKYFNLNHGQNYKLLADVFMKEGIYESAFYYINRSLEYAYDCQVELLLAQNLMYRENYQSAYNIFNKLYKNDENNLDCVRYMIVLDILMERKFKASQEVKKLNKTNIDYEKTFLTVIEFMYSKDGKINEKDEVVVNEIFVLINEFIILRKDSLYKFISEKLGKIKSRNFHLRLATTFEANGLVNDASLEVFKSIKQYDEISREGIDILSKLIK